MVLSLFLFSFGEIVKNTLMTQYKGEFFAGCMFILRSKYTLYLMTLTFFICILKFTIFLQSIFFGEIRLLEEEHLKEYSIRFFMDYTFSLMTLRHSFDYSYIIGLISILSLKSLHWILKDRVDWMDQIPRLPKYFREKIYSLSLILFITNILAIKNSLSCPNIPSGTCTTDEFSLRLLIFKEISFCFITLVGIFIKFLIHLKERDVEDERPPPPLFFRPFHHMMLRLMVFKNIFIFYLDAVLDLLRFIIILIYFYKVLSVFGVPIQDILIQGHRFVFRFKEIVKYIIASRKMDSSFSTATEEYLNTLPDKVCIICRDDMSGSDNHGNNTNNSPITKRLKCGHCFHFECLRSWLERQQTCPTCRKDIIDTSTEQQQQQPPPPQIYPAYQRGGPILEEIEFPPNVVRLQSGSIIAQEGRNIFRRNGIPSDDLVIASTSNSSLSFFEGEEEEGEGDALDILSDKVSLLSDEIDLAILEFENDF